MFRKLPLALMSRFVASVTRLSSIALVFASAIALVVPSGAAQAGVVDPGTSVADKTQAAWTADWWQWALSFPFASSPMFDDDGSRAGYGNTGPVFFVAGAFGGDYTRTFNVPAGKPLFVPVANTIGLQNLEADTEESLRALAKKSIDGAVVNWETVTVNGLQLPEYDPLLNDDELEALMQKYRPQSPLIDLSSPLLPEFGICWNGSAPPPDGIRENLDCVPPSVYEHGAAVPDGYWLMLEPLSLGQKYKVVVNGSFEDGTTLSITANITAVPEPSTMALLAGGVVFLFGIRRRTLHTAAGAAS